MHLLCLMTELYTSTVALVSAVVTIAMISGSLISTCRLCNYPYSYKFMIDLL